MKNLVFLKTTITLSAIAWILGFYFITPSVAKDYFKVELTSKQIEEHIKLIDKEITNLKENKPQNYKDKLLELYYEKDKYQNALKVIKSEANPPKKKKKNKERTKAQEKLLEYYSNFPQIEYDVFDKRNEKKIGRIKLFIRINNGVIFCSTNFYGEKILFGSEVKYTNYSTSPFSLTSYSLGKQKSFVAEVEHKKEGFSEFRLLTINRQNNRQGYVTNESYSIDAEKPLLDMTGLLLSLPLKLYSGEEKIHYFEKNILRLATIKANLNKTEFSVTYEGRDIIWFKTERDTDENKIIVNQFIYGNYEFIRRGILE